MWSRGRQRPPGDRLLSCASHTGTLWRALAVEPGLTAQVLGLLLEKLSRDVPFKEGRAFLLSTTPDRVATLLPLAVSADWGRRAAPLLPSCPGGCGATGGRAGRGVAGGAGCCPAGTWPPARAPESSELGARLVKALQVLVPKGAPLFHPRENTSPAGQASTQSSCGHSLRLPLWSLEQLVRPCPRAATLPQGGHPAPDLPLPPAPEHLAGQGKALVPPTPCLPGTKASEDTWRLFRKGAPGVFGCWGAEPALLLIAPERGVRLRQFLPPGHLCPVRGHVCPGLRACSAGALPPAVCGAPAACQLHCGRPVAPEPAGQGEEE